MVCDVTKPETLEQLDGWIEELRKHVSENIVMAVAGNKSDMEKVITPARGKEYALKYNSPYFETSAKTGDGVQAIFTYIAKELLKNQNQVESSILSNGSTTEGGGDAAGGNSGASQPASSGTVQINSENVNAGQGEKKKGCC